MENLNFENFVSIKGEFEAEGLTRDEVAAEALFAARNGLNYLVKISGAEAKSDILYLERLGISSIVCPMIESKFAMKKYMDMLRVGVFQHIGVTIETISAISNIDEIIEEGKLLTELTIGRTDLTASWGGDSVESSKTIEMVKVAARVGRTAGLKITMGGSVSSQTRELLEMDSELYDLIDYVETRKAVIPVEAFLKQDSLESALQLEATLLEKRKDSFQRIQSAINSRLTALSARI